MQNVFLIGYMGAGKTTIGGRLAKRLGKQFVDTDRFIENRYRKKISELFAEKGEASFREIERSVLQEVAQFENTVVSTGGGAPCFFDNMDLMNRSGVTVYLKVSESGLTERLLAGRQQRPLVGNKTEAELKEFIADSLGKREAWYSRASIVLPAEHLSTPDDIDRVTENLIKQIIN
jgi:shikimate kinase